MTKKEQIKRLKTIAFTVALSTTVGLTGCGKGNSNYFSDTMRGRNNNTCFDELIGDDYFDKIDELEKYIYLSNTLDSMNLKDNTTIDDYSNTSLLYADEIYSLLTNYKDKDYTEVSKDEIRSKLYVQNKLINAYLRGEGYSIMATATLLGLKARVADAAGLSETEASLFRVMDQKTFEEITDFPFASVYIGDYDISRCNDYIELLKSVYKMQSNESVASNKNVKAVYNKERNKFILRAINILRDCMSRDYKVDSKNRVRRK